MVKQPQYEKGQFVLLSYSETIIIDGEFSYKTHIDRAFQIVKADYLPSDGGDLLVEGILKATGQPLQDVPRHWSVDARALDDGSVHHFGAFYLHYPKIVTLQDIFPDQISETPWPADDWD